MSNTNLTTLGASVDLVLEEVRNVKELHRSTRGTKLLQFAIDVCLVAHGVRTGYLVDAVYPSNPMQTLTTLLKNLRGRSTAFKNVALWHHTQSFLVHVHLLQERLATLLGGTGECIFIKLDKWVSVLREPPDRLREAIRDMRLSMTGCPDALSFSLSDALTEEVLIPLAAVMIDYPVAYCPALAAQTSFLRGEPLDIYTVSLRGATPSDSALDLSKGHALLKFSCPQVLVSDHAELLPGTMINNLCVKFSANLARADIGVQVFVAHRTEALDRVAL